MTYLIPMKKLVIRCNLLFQVLPSVYFVLMGVLLYLCISSCVSCALTSRTIFTLDSINADKINYEKLDTFLIKPLK